jgi:DNA-3-methyladenine glycosylase
MQLQKTLPGNFFTKDALQVAPALLGKTLVKKQGRTILSGIIVEVEAYHGDDEASHSFGGMKNRNRPMFLEGGYVYVYFTYGAHFCLNFVTGKPGDGQAVLIRAVQPLHGESCMIFNRFKTREILSDKKRLLLTNGPGKLCSAFGISKDDNGIRIGEGKITVTKGQKIPLEMIGSLARIGISKAQDKQWRFFIKDNPWVSK